MSVEIQGIQGYEYQYSVTLLIALHYLRKREISILVESVEDTQIMFNENGVCQELYIQAKSHNQSVGFLELCTWLGHFGGRQASNCLMQRLQGKNARAIFVTTGRCKDQLISYLNQNFLREKEGDTSGTRQGRKWSQENKNDASILRGSLLEQYSGETTLQKERAISIQNFLGEVSDKELKERLEQVDIIEQQSKEKIDAQIFSLLNHHYAIKTSCLQSVKDQLEKCVRTGRDDGHDIAPDMCDIIDKYTQRLLPEGIEYLKIPQQQACEEALDQKNALLLTGLPFCGKTITAQAIAQAYAKLGFEVFQTNSLDEGVSFFNSLSDEKRFLLLEDPFGAIQVSGSKAEHARMLRMLVKEKTSAIRKVIITTREDILFTVFDKKTIAECTIGDCKWFDLSMLDARFAKSMWCTVYDDSQESLLCFEQIKEYIERQEHGIFFEIGEIRNLNRTCPDVRKLATQKMEDILRAARISSKDVVEKICGEGGDSTRVYLALYATCNTIRKVSYQELAYVLSDVEEFPGLRSSTSGARGVSISLGGRNKPSVPYPAYTQLYRLTELQNQILVQFEKCGYISIERKKEAIHFLHPIFCYAGKLLFLKGLQDALDCERLLSIGHRAIGALDKNVNLCAVEFLYGCLEEKSEYQEQLIVTLSHALNSRYPAVRDKAILFLETAFDELSPEQQKQLMGAVHDTEFDKYVLWQDGEAICYPENMIEITLARKKSDLTMEQVNAIKTRAECSAENMYNILQSTLRKQLPVRFLTVALNYDESFIRETAVRLLFEYHAKELDVRKYLNEFVDCGVICQMFLGALQAWPQYSAVDRQQILDYFTSQLERVPVAFKAEGFLDKLAREGYTGFSWGRFSEEKKRLVWEAWCVAFTQFMRQFRADFIRMDEVHMDQCISTMLRYVNNSELLKSLFYEWNKWLHKIKAPSDYGMCLVENILQCLSPDDADRFALLQELLQEKHTSLATSHIKYLTDCWNLLTEPEREMVKNILTAPREDQQWLQAIVLTRKEIPSELQTLLLGKVPISISDWLSSLRETELLEPCLNIYCGYPQPLWYNGYHHTFKERWTNIIAEELKTDPNPDSKAFKIVLREFIYYEYEWDPCFESFREEIWKHLLSDEQRRICVFEELLRVTVTVNQENKGLWSRYISHCNLDELTRAFKKIVDVIEAVEYYQDEGCYDLFDSALIEKYLYRFLATDHLLSNLCRVIIMNQKLIARGFAEFFNMDDLFHKFEDLALNLYREQPPRMKWTRKLVLYTMNLIGRKSPELDGYLEQQRCVSIDRAREQQELFDDHYTLEKWKDK